MDSLRSGARRRFRDRHHEGDLACLGDARHAQGPDLMTNARDTGRPLRPRPRSHLELCRVRSVCALTYVNDHDHRRHRHRENPEIEVGVDL